MVKKVARKNEAPRLPLRRDRHRVGLPGNETMIIGSAFLPPLQQEGGASSRLARERVILGLVSLETKRCTKTHDEARVEKK
jgi:hypothetical protein